MKYKRILNVKFGLNVGTYEFRYASMTRKINKSYLLQEVEVCQICTNSLDECELEYADADLEYK